MPETKPKDHTGRSAPREVARVWSIHHEDYRQRFGIVGSLVLLLGVFCPVASARGYGTLLYLHHLHGHGRLMIGLGIAALLLAFCRAAFLVAIIGLVGLVMTLYDIGFEVIMEGNMTVREDPFLGLAPHTPQLQWGWVVLLVGAGLLLTSLLLPSSPANGSS